MVVYRHLSSHASQRLEAANVPVQPRCDVSWRGVGCNNDHLRTLIVALFTTGGHPYPFRVPCRFGGKAGYVVVDQVRTVDHERLLRRLGRLAPGTLGRALSVLQEMFAP